MKHRKHKIAVYVEKLLRLVFRPIDLFLIKEQISNETYQIVDSLKKTGLPEKDKLKLTQFMTSPSCSEVNDLFMWMQKFFHEITESDFQKKKQLLYSYRWDIACLSQAEYLDLQDHLETDDMFYVENVNEIIRQHFLEIQTNFMHKEFDKIEKLSKSTWVVPPKTSLLN